MTLTYLKLLLFGLVALTGLLIGWGAATAVSPFAAFLVLLPTGLWLFWLAQGGQRWPDALAGLVALLGALAVWALLADPPGGLPLYFGLLGLLAAWDLSGAYGRFQQPEAHIADLGGLIRARNGRLLALLVISALALPLVGRLSVPFQFDWVLLLAVLLLFSLRFLVGQTKRPTTND
jgi:hypothetical protein